MERKEFQERLKEVLMLLKEEEMVITFNTINGQHGEEPLGFTISTKAPAASPTFYSFDDLYWVYTKCPSVIDIALGVIKLSKMSNGDMAINEMDIECYEIVKKKLGLMVIGEKEQGEYLESLVHDSVEDLALVPIIFRNENDRTECLTIKKGVPEIWGVTEQEVVEDAKASSPRIMPPAIRETRLEEEDAYIIPSSNDDDLPEEAYRVFVISNKYFWHGASVVFYPDFFEGFRQAFRKNIFVLPISTNEMYLLKDLGQDPTGLLRYVEKVHRTDILSKGTLPDAVYYFSEKEGFRKIMSKEIV